MKMKFLKIFLALLSVGLISCQATNQSGIESENTKMQGQKIRVSSGSSVSTYSIFFTEIMNIGLEELGYKTEPIKQLDIPISHVAVSNGDLDFYGVHWEKVQNKFFTENGGEEKFKVIMTL